MCKSIFKKCLTFVALGFILKKLKRTGNKIVTIDLDLLKEEAALASEMNALELRLNEIKSTLLIRLANFVADEDFDRANPSKAVKALRGELLDDNGFNYAGYENLSDALKNLEFSSLLEKKIVDNNWYSSQECRDERSAYDLSVHA
jgi:hypothetical protein